VNGYDSAAEEKLTALLRRDRRYPREAYEFIHEALGYTGRLLKKSGHLSGQELCHGARRLALERFGYLARTVLDSWNVRRTDDFGNLVYNLIEVGLLHKSEGDSIEDFHEVYDFAQAFDQAFRIELETR
jgi:uncharacterized repeat protein (TIGR04138 family)